MHKLSAKTLECASLKASWIGPGNCTVNTTETDTAEKARSEWVVVHDAPFHPKVDKLSSGAAFVCQDIHEPFDHELSYMISAIAALAPKINRGGCVIIVASAEQVCFEYMYFACPNFKTCTLPWLVLARSNCCYPGRKSRVEAQCEADTFFNYFVWDVRSDGRHSKQVNILFQCVNCYHFPILSIRVCLNIRYLCSLICWLARVWCLSTLLKVPSKENPFNASFHANTHVPSNAYPAASDVILVFHSLYVRVRHKTGKVCSCCVLALYGASYVLK